MLIAGAVRGNWPLLICSSEVDTFLKTPRIMGVSELHVVFSGSSPPVQFLEGLSCKIV